ncbi:hypothetical protein ACO0LG_17035 [Undibacterium sp. Ji42W]|uniref:hypothetical protein n=1 Tax=Undibacterium sp. Ji42W TaxID=3413039 RepID=UPI003BF11E8C
MDIFNPNAVKVAIDRLGGPTKAAHIMSVSNTTIHAWIKRGKIVDIDKAMQMSKVSGIELQKLRSTY